MQHIFFFLFPFCNTLDIVHRRFGVHIAHIFDVFLCPSHIHLAFRPIFLIAVET